MAKPYKTELPRKWKNMRDRDILEFVGEILSEEDMADEHTESVIYAMLDELDTREETRNTRFPDDWDEDDITVSSYLS